jgi:hypothetical protein
MGIYWCAIDEYRKEKIKPPANFSNKSPGLFHPNSPFPGIVIMMNTFGNNFEIINDSDWEGPYYDNSYEDITEKVYKKYLDYFQIKEKEFIKDNMDLREGLFDLIKIKKQELEVIKDRHDFLCDEIITLQQAFDQDAKKLTTEDEDEMLNCIRDIIKRQKT